MKHHIQAFIFFFVTSVVYFQWYIQVYMCLMRHSIVQNITKIGWNFCLHLLKHIEILWTIWMQIYYTWRKKSNSFYHVYDSKIEHETSIFRKRQCMMFKCWRNIYGLISFYKHQSRNVIHFNILLLFSFLLLKVDLHVQLCRFESP